MDRSMARETRSHARVACEGPRPTVKGGRAAAKKPSGYRSAGACPPRASLPRGLGSRPPPGAITTETDL